MKTASETNFKKEQLHAGKHPRYPDTNAFHTNSEGLWWSEFFFQDLTAEQLLKICRSTEHDLLNLYPELK